MVDVEVATSPPIDSAAAAPNKDEPSAAAPAAEADDSVGDSGTGDDLHDVHATAGAGADTFGTLETLEGDSGDVSHFDPPSETVRNLNDAHGYSDIVLKLKMPLSQIIHKQLDIDTLTPTD